MLPEYPIIRIREAFRPANSRMIHLSNKYNMKIPGLAKWLLFILVTISCTSPHGYHSLNTAQKESGLQQQLASGWNTWNTRSVLSHVLLPECYSINILMVDHHSSDTLKEALIGRRGAEAEKVIPGPHADDGSYTKLSINWRRASLTVESAASGDSLAIIIKPEGKTGNYSVIIQPDVLWGRPGAFALTDSGIVFSGGQGKTALEMKGPVEEITQRAVRFGSSGNIYLSSFPRFTTEKVEDFIHDSSDKLKSWKRTYNQDSMLFDAMQTVLAWDVIYEPEGDRVISPVSRIWNCNWGGWVLFDWDTYFASLMYAMYDKELAYANALAITGEITDGGFIPNFGSGDGKSRDRSQPPIGSYVINQIYKKYREKWFLQSVYPELLSWNRWWEENRDVNGFLCWGTDPYQADDLPEWLTTQIGKKQAAMWESGLDNSPMYENAPFDKLHISIILLL